MKLFKIKVKDWKTGRIVEYEYDNHKAYLNKFAQLRKHYDIVEETTASAIVVSKKPDLFD